jgi:signal transduction histidine kinase
VRRRLTLTLLGLVAGALLLAGVGTLLLTQSDARHQATAQLVDQARIIATSARDVRHPVELATVRRVLRLEQAEIVGLSSLVQQSGFLPDGLTAADLDPSALVAGRTVSGVSGNIAYAAVPVDPTLADRVRLHIGPHPVVILTRQVGGLGPSWEYFVLIGAGTLLVAAVVAWRLGRRVTRPLVNAVGATERIARGDLDARVGVEGGDLPELVSLAASINSMAVSLTRSRMAERDLLMSVTHDLRTPLTSIRGYAEAIAEGVVADPAQAARVIMGESGRLERLVTDLLDLARLRMQRLSFDLQPVDGAVVVQQVVEGFQPLAARSGLTITAALPHPVPPVRADPDRLAQIVANLVENAATFAETEVVVSLSPPPEGTTGPAMLTVDDDGSGIPPGEQQRVFERFYRADQATGRRIGSGMGLAIVAELVAAMGGEVAVVSPARAGRGTSMRVTLPADPASTTASVRPAASGTSSHHQARWGRPVDHEGAGG